jgi:light-regulated signal transduction histidine kinase (bacteriophytochrome)
VTIAVSDTGIGIREDKQKHLFQWFSQIETTGRPACRRYGARTGDIDRLSRCSVARWPSTSRPGKGSTFTLCSGAESG